MSECTHDTMFDVARKAKRDLLVYCRCGVATYGTFDFEREVLVRLDAILERLASGAAALWATRPLSEERSPHA